MTIHAATVAVVDDDARVLESLEDLLEWAGHSVVLFTSGEALLETDVLPDLDCLITDIGIPALDGFELRRRARAIRPDLPVIFITGRHEVADEKRAAHGGHQGFFRKPFDSSALLAAVNEALSTPDEERNHAE